MRILWNNNFHTVMLDDGIHLYRPSHQITLCGRNKVGMPRIHEDFFTCLNCRDTLLVEAIDSVQDHYRDEVVFERSVA